MFDRRSFLTAAFALLLPLGGCTVQPLYGGPAAGANVQGRVSVAAVSTRPAQQVRNRLVYLLNGGAGDPASAEFEARLSVFSSVQSSVRVTGQGGDGESSAGKAVMRGTIVLVRVADGETIVQSTRHVEAPFDRTTQQFANKRAQLDAENRAAAELATILRDVILAEIAGR